MKNIKSALKNLPLLAAVLAICTSCDKDFVSLDSDISGENNFGMAKSKYEVIGYTDKLNPIQTNGLPSNLFGIYNDETYGKTVANVVTQLSPTTYNPDFPTDVLLDSVVLTVPYFSKSNGRDNEATLYKLDSVYGSKPFNLKVYENTYFLRNFDPNSGFNTPQKYYSNRSLSASSQIPLAALQGSLLKAIDSFLPSNKEIKVKRGEDYVRSAPALRFKMDPIFWTQKIINKKGGTELSNANNFQNYFRGLYFEAEALNNDGSMVLLNFNNAAANITLYYSSPATGTETERKTGTYILNFVENRANFFENDFTTTIPQGNPVTGDEKLYLKGGEGSVALINLFDGTNTDNDEGTLNAFETFKNEYVVTDASGKFVKAKRMINEANLVFFVDQSLTKNQEPERVYLYNTKSGTILLDYEFDTADDVQPINSRINHLGKLKRSGSNPNDPGVKYTIKITEHIKNLLLKDSTNVTLGLAVSSNINAELIVSGQTVIRTPQKAVQSASATSTKTVPVSSILSPRGTVLYGNNTSDQKKLYLEIFYTEPNN